MKTSLALIVLLIAAVPLLVAVEVGDTYEKVVREKGAPTGTMNAGGTQILRYADQTIKLKEGKVVSISVTPPAAERPPTPTARPKTPRPAPARVVAPAVVWTSDYAAALEEAKAQNRHVFLFFTGSDWCGWCKRLVREILATPEFADYAGQNLVLVELDFPRSKPLEPEVKAQNERLAQRHQVRGFPTAVVLDSAGRPVGRLGYQEGGPKPFIQKLSEL